jgi:fatty acid desaturase
MLPRRAADYRSILWALMMPAVLIAQYANPKLVTYLWPVSFYFAMAAGTMAHNHNHCPTFKSKAMNNFYALWISLFYGYPSFAWIPTHNLNHHKHVNREGDATITWRITKRNTLWMAVIYFFVSAYYQAGPINEYRRKAREKNPGLHRTIVTQYVVWGTWLVATFVLAVTMHGWALGFKIYALTVGLPTLFGPWCMMWFNYMQHVHADPWSEHNHSRNITGRVFNFLVFNNGLHTIHHENPGSHWGDAYKFHAEIADKVHPDLNWRSFWWWVIRGYVLPTFLPMLETKQIGRAPYDPPEGRRVAMRENGPMTDSVDALEAGNNAQMA